MMANAPVRVLCVQGPAPHLESLKRVRDQAANFGLTVVAQLGISDAVTCLSSNNSDIQATILWADVGHHEFAADLAKVVIREVPVILVSTNVSGEKELHQAVGLGAHDCLVAEETTTARLARKLSLAIQRQRWRHNTENEALAIARAEIERSQQQVRDSEALYHSLVENLVQNIFRKNCDGCFTFANTNFCLTVGKHVDQVLGRTDFDLFPKDLAQKYQSDDLKVINSGEVLEAEEEHVNSDDKRIVVKVVKTPVFNAAGEIAGMQGIFWDITEQKRNQEALAASRERFGLAVRGSTDGIWDWEIGSNKIYFSTRFKQLLGYNYDEMENRPEEWEDRLHPEDHESAMIALNNHLQHDRPYDVECRLRCKDGIYRWFRARGLAVRNEANRATRMAGSISDITTRREAEDQLRARTEDLERSNRDLEQFAYIASHDLKEPLRMVSSYVQLLEHRYKDKLDESAKDFIGFAASGSKRMKRLIDGLLEFSQVGTHGQELKPISMEEVLSDSLANLEIFIQERKASVTHDPLPEVLADTAQLGQLLQNLVGNGLKFCRADMPKVHLSAKFCEHQNVWMVSVRDNGIGIKEEHIDKIFQIYQRLHSRAEYDGTGIGLAVCRKIVERHRGKIWVESTLGEGSTFKFTLNPASEAPFP